MHYRKGTLDKAEKEGIALTFDDVRLIPDYAEILPDQVDLTSKFSRNIPLKIPLVSAAMDTITEYKMAIEMAKCGGLGIIHKNLSPKEQARQVSKVKHYLNGKIEDPICVSYNDTVQDVLNMKEAKGYTFDSFPVKDSDGKLMGVITKNNFKFCNDLSKKIKDIMKTPLITASENTTIEEAYKILLDNEIGILPLIKGSSELVGIYILSDVKRIVTANSGMYNTDSSGKLIVGAAIEGVSNSAFARLEELVRTKVDVVVIDTAHGHSKNVIDTLRAIKEQYPQLDVVVGNVATGKGAKALVDAGADGVKVGVGPGSICTTRIISGAGVPQVYAIYDSAKAISGSGVPVCGDGGLRYSGDITIAIAAGADCVMAGNMFGGTDESPGDIVIRDGRQWKSYRGMGSLGAMKHKGSRERYQQGDRKMKDLVPEGIESLSPYKGKLSDLLIQYVGGLRAGMGYTGAKSIEELQKNAQFCRVTKAGIDESHPHNVVITAEASNYSGSDSNA